MTGPLSGRVILVTRAPGQAAELSTRLRELGATPIEAPAIRLEASDRPGPLDDAIREDADGGFAWVVFTSAAGVMAWFERAEAVGFGRIRGSVAAVGDATAEALRAREQGTALVPSEFTTAALGEAFPAGTGRVLLPRADRASGELEVVLRGKGWTPVRIEAYRIRSSRRLPEEARSALEDGRVDALTFTSPSTVEGFVRLYGIADGTAVACIGPVTAEAARSAGFVVDAVADPHTIDGLIEAVRRLFE